MLLLHRGRPPTAVELLADAARAAHRLGQRHVAAVVRGAWAEAAVLAGAPGRRRRLRAGRVG